MLPETYQRLAERENHYWWYRARRRMAVGLLRKHGLRNGIRAIDIGCGCGGNLAIFDSFEPSLVVGTDLSPIALDHARRQAREALLVRADLNVDLPFFGESFDVATVFNVLYHDWVTDDRATLRRINALLRPGALLLVTEPAFEALRRGIDRATLGRRRYLLSDFRMRAESVGFTSVFGGYFSSFVFPIALAMGIADRVRGRMRTRDSAQGADALDSRALGEPMNELLFRLAACEADAIVHGLMIPFGVTLVSVFRRP